MGGKGLTGCWRGAMAAKPSTWAIRGVALGPRDADPAIRGATWTAWATGPDVVTSEEQLRFRVTDDLDDDDDYTPVIESRDDPEDD